MPVAHMSAEELFKCHGKMLGITKFLILNLAWEGHGMVWYGKRFSRLLPIPTTTTCFTLSSLSFTCSRWKMNFGGCSDSQRKRTSMHFWPSLYQVEHSACEPLGNKLPNPSNEDPKPLSLQNWDSTSASLGPEKLSLPDVESANELEYSVSSGSSFVRIPGTLLLVNPVTSTGIPSSYVVALFCLSNLPSIWEILLLKFLYSVQSIPFITRRYTTP
nr:hypothetical protein Iba_chr14aCG23840 [Ipomoea batatas]